MHREKFSLRAERACIKAITQAKTVIGKTGLSNSIEI